MTSKQQLTTTGDQHDLTLNVLVQVLGRNELPEEDLGVVVEGEEEDLEDEDYVLDDLLVVGHFGQPAKAEENFSNLASFQHFKSCKTGHECSRHAETAQSRDGPCLGFN